MTNDKDDIGGPPRNLRSSSFMRLDSDIQRLTEEDKKFIQQQRKRWKKTIKQIADAHIIPDFKL